MGGLQLPKRNSKNWQRRRRQLERRRVIPGAPLPEIKQKLQAHPLVRRVKLTHGEFKVAWHDGIVEWLPAIQNYPRHPSVRRVYVGTLTTGVEVPEIREADALGQPGSGHFLIPAADLIRLGIVEQRFVVHVLLQRLLAQGWQPLQHDQGTVQADLRRVRDEDLSHYWWEKGKAHHYITGHVFCARDLRRTSYSCGRTIWENMPLFSDVVERGFTRPSRWDERPPGIQKFADLPVLKPYALREVWRSATVLSWLLSTVVERKMALSLRNLLWIASSRWAFVSYYALGPRWTEPGFYRRIFQDLGLVGVHDLHPQLGLKALAALTDGRRFSFRPDGVFENCLGAFREMTNAEVFTERGPRDAVWADFNFTVRPFEDLRVLVDEYPDLIIFVPSRWRRMLWDYRRPSWGFNIYLRPENIPAHFFCYGQIYRQKREF